MNLFQQIATTVGALVAGIAIGWFAMDPVAGAKGGEGDAARSERGSAAAFSRPAKSLQGIASTEPPEDQVRAALGLADGLSAAELAEWIDQKHYLTGDRLLDGLVASILSDRLLELDPAAAMERVLGEELNTFAKRHEASSHMAKWMREDIEGAEAFLLSRQRPKDFWTLARPVLEEMVGTDPERALSLIDLLQRSAPGNTASWVRGAIRELAASHRAALLGSLEEWRPTWRWVAKGQVAGAWLGEDFAGGLKWMQDSLRGYDLFHLALTENAGFTPVLITHLRDLPADWRTRAVTGNARDIVRRNPEDWLRADAATLGIEEEQVAVLHRAAEEFIKLRDRR